MQGDRLVGELWCREVLSDLSDFIDGELDPAKRSQIEDHLRGCDVCERFGGEYADAVRQTRRVLATAEPLTTNVQLRLRARIESEIANPES